MKTQIDRLRQCPSDVLSKIEIIISDNCSSDDTRDVVMRALDEGFPCIYNRNKENLGMDGNFVTCFRMAKGKYVWLLGDDDSIIPEALGSIVEELEKDAEYGLVHINRNVSTTNERFIKYTDSDLFARTISYNTTFISGNIVRTKYVPQIDFEKYMGTWFTLMPLYITAFLKEDYNLLINFRVFEEPKDNKRNGGYNYFQVFVKNYLDIWGEYKDKKAISIKTFEYLKKDSYKALIAPHIYGFFLYNKRDHNYKLDDAWKIIFQYYGTKPYAYSYLIKYVCRRAIGKVRRSWLK